MCQDLFICCEYLKRTTRSESANNINITAKLWHNLSNFAILIHYANVYFNYIYLVYLFNLYNIYTFVSNMLRKNRYINIKKLTRHFDESFRVCNTLVQLFCMTELVWNVHQILIDVSQIIRIEYMRTYIYIYVYV